MAQGYSFPGRKGNVLMTRLGTQIPTESTIEEKLLRILDMDAAVVSARRAEAVAVYAPDGTKHEYTPDVLVTLSDGRTLSLECKPEELLGGLLLADVPGWEARATRLEQMGQPLQIIIERDLPDALLQHAQSFGPFYGVDADPNIKEKALTFLSDRSAMPLSVLRQHVLILTDCSTALLDGTLYGMIARHELVTDSTVRPPQCLVDLPGRKIVPLPTPLGRPLRVLLADLPTWVEIAQEETVFNPGLLLESKFLATPRGTRMLKLFSLYSDPTRPLTNRLAKELGSAAEVSGRTVHRFRGSLRDAGAPGITFTELVPHLKGPAPRRPTRQVDASTATLIEKLAGDSYFVRVGTLGRFNTLSDLHSAVRKACLAVEGSPPAYTTIQRFVKRIERRDPVRSALLRDGPEQAQKLETRMGHLEVNRYGETLTIDCTPCDIMSTEEGLEVLPIQGGRGKGQRRKNAHRGKIVVVTDAITAQVLRSRVFRGAINAARILQVLRDVFLGDITEFTNAGILAISQGAGLPPRIRMDSGPEFVNKNVERVINKLGIERLPRNKFSRHNGGLEERTIGTLIHAQHVFPGTTMNNIERRGDYDAKLHAILTIDDINRFNQRVLSEHNNLPAPLQILTRQQHAQQLLDNGVSLWRPLSPSQTAYVKTRMHPQEDRRARNIGIRLHGLQYTSSKLRLLIARREKIEVFFDQDDISTANAVHPDTGEIITLHARLPQGLCAPLSLAEWNDYKSRVTSARQNALDRSKTPQQHATEIMAERDARQESRKRQQRKASGKSKTTSKQGELDPEEVSTSQYTIKAAIIQFADSPPKAIK
jgi:Mu transposase, C-terminal